MEVRTRTRCVEAHKESGDRVVLNVTDLVPRQGRNLIATVLPRAKAVKLWESLGELLGLTPPPNDRTLLYTYQLPGGQYIEVTTEGGTHQAHPGELRTPGRHTAKITEVRVYAIPPDPPDYEPGPVPGAMF